MGPSAVTNPISGGNREVSMANAPAVHNPEVTYDSSNKGHRAATAEPSLVGRLLWEDAAGLRMWENMAYGQRRQPTVPRLPTYAPVLMEFSCHMASAQFVNESMQKRFVQQWFVDEWCGNVSHYLGVFLT